MIVEPSYFVYRTALGRVTIASNGQAVTRLVFGPAHLEGKRHPCDVTTRAADQVLAYLAGRRRLFDVPTAPQGTAFQREVWSCLCTIPYGQTRTYAQVAEMIGRPQSFRAVGAACRANPIPLIIPCHRVVAAHGLGGYVAGEVVKRFLLDLERDKVS